MVFNAIKLILPKETWPEPSTHEARERRTGRAEQVVLRSRRAVFIEKMGLHDLNLSRKISPLGHLWWRGRLIDPVKENLNTKMLKKYTKYVATAFAVASLSTFIIGCGGEDDGGEPTEDTVEMPETEGTDPDEGTEDEPAETKPE